MQFHLSDGTVVEVVSNRPLTLDTFEELIDYLNVYKKVLAKQAGKTVDELERKGGG